MFSVDLVKVAMITLTLAEWTQAVGQSPIPEYLSGQNEPHASFISKDRISKKTNRKRHSERRGLQKLSPDRATCSQAINRLKNDKQDYSAILAAGKKWTDETFTYPEVLHSSELPSTEKDIDNSKHGDKTKWQRLQDNFSNPTYSMWGTQGVRPEDVIQSDDLGSCWLVVSGAMVAEEQNRVETMFLTDELNGAGVYAAELFLLGLPITVVVDDYLPMDANQAGKTFYQKIPDDGAMWGLIFEKMAAKFFGNYEVIDGGESSAGVEVMTGAPFKDYKHSDIKNDSAKKEEFWQALLATDSDKGSVVGNTFDGDD